ncbi:unnamed protein product [Prunus armeniaca]
MLITQYCAHEPSPAACEKASIVLHPCQDSKMVKQGAMVGTNGNPCVKEEYASDKELHPFFFSSVSFILKTHKESRWRLTPMGRSGHTKPLEPQRAPYPCTLDRKIVPNRIEWEEAKRNEGKC